MGMKYDYEYVIRIVVGEEFHEELFNLINEIEEFAEVEILKEERKERKK